MEGVRVVGGGGGGLPVLSSTHRLVLGIVVLFSVDIIWVASSELSEHIFHNEKFDKPFYSTYVKTSMFLIFLVGFIFWTPWHERCTKKNSHQYTLLTAGNESINATEDDILEDDELAGLSPSAFVPVNYDPNSGNESDESAQNRSVHFSKLVEVRHMSDKEAGDALFARMSYQASIQAEELAYRLANRLSPGETARLALTFCILVYLYLVFCLATIILWTVFSRPNF